MGMGEALDTGLYLLLYVVICPLPSLIAHRVSLYLKKKGRADVKAVHLRIVSNFAESD